MTVRTDQLLERFFAFLDREVGLDRVLNLDGAATLAGDGRGHPRGAQRLPRTSGDLMYTTRPYILVDDEPTGTSHGSQWSYDTQVPLLWPGPVVRPGPYHSEASVADIAPTLAAFLGSSSPADPAVEC